MKPTVRNIAEKANVSVASVSLVLNDKPSRITEDTKKRIFEAAKELGYDFDKKRKKNTGIYENGGKNPKSDMIGVIRSRYNSEFLDLCQKGIDEYSRIYGYRTIVHNVNDDTEQTIDGIRFLSGLKVGGLIVIPPTDMNLRDNNERLGEALRSTGIPFLLLEEAINKVYCDFITADNKSGGYMAAEYLIRNGHREIGMITGPREVYTCRKRVGGYKEALVFNNIPVKDEYIFYGGGKRGIGYEGMEYLDKLGIRAVVAYDDETALGVYQYAGEHGYIIGEDISVVGFNDMFAASFLNPPLTTVAQSGELMGKKACETVIKRITREDREAVRDTYFTPVLVERKSVKVLNKSE